MFRRADNHRGCRCEGESLSQEDMTDTCSQLPPPMSCCIPSTSLLTASSSADVTSASCHVTQPDDSGASLQPAARPTTLLATYLPFVVIAEQELTANSAIKR